MNDGTEPQENHDEGKPVSGETITPAVETPESAAIAEASSLAVAAHVAETAPKPKPRGRPRRYPAAGTQALPSNSAAMDQKPGPVAAGAVSAPAPAPFDTKAAGMLIDGGIEVLNEIAKTVIGIVAKKHKCSPEETKLAVEGVQVSDKARELIKEGGLLCAQKYSVSTGSAPEMILGGGLLLWGSGVFMTYRAIAQEETEPKKTDEN